jgi:Protein of unknown function (DUF2934)
MPRTQDQIMEVIIRSPGCLLEEVVLECPGLTWNQVFTEIERMSRTGLVQLQAKGLGLYTVTASTISKPSTLSNSHIASKEDLPMKKQTMKESHGYRERGAPGPQPAVGMDSVHGQPMSDCDDVQARIAKRAYELHAERGYRQGYALEDWVEAEREVLGPACSA